jgi:hypothetical protein
LRKKLVKFEAKHPMEKKKLKEEIMAALSQEVDLWLEEEDNLKDGYSYESTILRRSLNMGRTIMEKSIGPLSDNRNKKNFIPVLAKLK